MTTTVDPATRVYRTVNPTTGDVVREYATYSDEAAEDALVRAHAAFASWKLIPIAERVRLFARLAELLEANTDEMARLVTLEMGKPLGMSLREMAGVAGMYRYFAEHGARQIGRAHV